MYQTEVVVIGGGATGAGALRDAALRGFKTLLLERSDFGSGTSGRYHGLLHSGGRYAVKDPLSARECIAENIILRRIAAASIEDTGGLFVTTPDDDPAYADRFVAACHDTGIPLTELSIAEMLEREPRLNPAITRAFAVPDASCEPWALIEGNIRSAQAYGGDAWPYHQVTAFERENSRITVVRVRDVRSGEEKSIACDFVINAAGAWAGQIGELADVPIRMTAGKGSMIGDEPSRRQHRGQSLPSAGRRRHPGTRRLRSHHRDDFDQRARSGRRRDVVTFPPLAVGR